MPHLPRHPDHHFPAPRLSPEAHCDTLWCPNPPSAEAISEDRKLSLVYCDGCFRQFEATLRNSRFTILRHRVGQPKTDVQVRTSARHPVTRPRARA